MRNSTYILSYSVNIHYVPTHVSQCLKLHSFPSPLQQYLIALYHSFSFPYVQVFIVQSSIHFPLRYNSILLHCTGPFIFFSICTGFHCPEFHSFPPPLQQYLIALYRTIPFPLHMYRFHCPEFHSFPSPLTVSHCLSSPSIGVRNKEHFWTTSRHDWLQASYWHCPQMCVCCIIKVGKCANSQQSASKITSTVL